MNNPRNISSESAEIIVFQKKGRAGVPADMCLLRSGELISSFREASNHTDINGEIALVRSHDGGLSWAEHQIVKHAEDPPSDYRDASICELSDGTLLLTFFSWRGQTHKGNWDGTRTWVMRSFDGGNTWPEEHILATDPFDFMLTTERGIELPNGRILMAVHAGSRAKRVQNAAIMYSDDKGASWSYLSTAQTCDWPPNAGWSMETSITKTKSGSIVAVSRTGRHMLQATTFDAGKTWTEHKELEDTPPDTQPSINSLSDGRLLLAYGDRGPRPRRIEYPFSIKVRLSEDEGKTWGEEIVLTDNLPHWDMGYPTSVEIEPSFLVTVYWRSKPPSQEASWPAGFEYSLCCKRWHLPNLQSS